MLANPSASVAALDRVRSIASHVSPSATATSARDALLGKADSDVVVVAAVRTPLTKAKKGGLKDTLPEEMLLAAFQGVLERSGIDPNLVPEIVVG